MKSVIGCVVGACILNSSVSAFRPPHIMRERFEAKSKLTVLRVAKGAECNPFGDVICDPATADVVQPLKKVIGSAGSKVSGGFLAREVIEARQRVYYSNTRRTSSPLLSSPLLSFPPPLPLSPSHRNKVSYTPSPSTTAGWEKLQSNLTPAKNGVLIPKQNIDVPSLGKIAESEGAQRFAKNIDITENGQALSQYLQQTFTKPEFPPISGYSFMDWKNYIDALDPTSKNYLVFGILGLSFLAVVGPPEPRDPKR